MTDLDALRAAVTEEITAALADQAAAVRRVGRLQDVLALANRVGVPVPDPGPTPEPDPVPTPDPTPRPAPTVARIGAAAYPIAAVDPAPDRVAGDGKRYAGGRGPDELVVYTRGGRTGTNAYGVEVPVVGGIAGTVTERRDGGIVVPAGGYVLSGHGRAEGWLKANARPGVGVELVDGGAQAPSGERPATGRVLAIYQMLYGAGNGLVSELGEPFTEIRGAFMLGASLSFPGWAGDGQERFVAAIQRGQDAGRRWVPSIGGAHNPVDLSNTQRVIDALRRQAAAGLRPDGIDIDVEASGLVERQILALADAAASEFGPIPVHMTPNGSNVGAYLPVSVALQRAGHLGIHAHQFYDSRVPLGSPGTSDTGTAFGRLTEALRAGLEPQHLGVAMMLPQQGDDPSKYWSSAQCVTNMQAIKVAIPDIGGAALWERSRVGTIETAVLIAKVLGL